MIANVDCLDVSESSTLPTVTASLTFTNSQLVQFFRYWSYLGQIQLIQHLHPHFDLFSAAMWCLHDHVQGTSYENMTIIIQNYVESLISKYPYWNRTLGADHFFVTCHDVGVRATEGVPLLVKNSIRVVCSPSYDVGFIPHKDVALPQVLQPFALPAGGNDIENR